MATSSVQPLRASAVFASSESHGNLLANALSAKPQFQAVHSPHWLSASSAGGSRVFPVELGIKAGIQPAVITELRVTAHQFCVPSVVKVFVSDVPDACSESPRDRHRVRARTRKTRQLQHPIGSSPNGEGRGVDVSLFGADASSEDDSLGAYDSSESSSSDEIDFSADGHEADSTWLIDDDRLYQLLFAHA